MIQKIRKDKNRAEGERNLAYIGLNVKAYQTGDFENNPSTATSKGFTLNS